MNSYEKYIFYPTDETGGELVFKNKFNIKNKQELNQKELHITTLIFTQNQFPKCRLDKGYLIFLNKCLFGDLYEFAGEIKKWDLSKGQDILGGYSVRYCPVNFVDSSLDDFFKGLNKINKETPINELSKQIADSWAYLWQIHPFYEGNTRTTALFMTNFLESKEIFFNKEVMAKSYHDFRNALVLYTIGKEEKLTNIILEGIDKNRTLQKRNEGNEIDDDLEI